MKTNDALKQLSDLDAKHQRFLFSTADLSFIFPEDQPKTLEKSINRLIKSGVLERLTKGLYLFSYAKNKAPYFIESIALMLRRYEYSYVSLESALSEYGLISQVPLGHLTVMTSGRSGLYTTPYGKIEFTHSDRTFSDLDKRCTVIDGRPLPMATEESALSDLKRVGRNLSMVERL